MRELCTVGDVVGKLYLPTGYVKANGAEVLREDYPRLVNLADKYNLWTEDTAAYPGMFGAGDRETTMSLPDMRGVVGRYLDEGKGLDDVNRALGAYQGDAMQNITGSLNYVSQSSGGDGGLFTVTSAVNSSIQARGEGDNWNKYVAFNASKVVRTSTENRMKNISVLAVIRY